MEVHLVIFHSMEAKALVICKVCGDHHLSKIFYNKITVFLYPIMNRFT